MAVSTDTDAKPVAPRPTRMQMVGYLIIIPLVFTTLMTIVLGASLGLFSFEPQMRALQSFGHSLPLLGGVVPAPQPKPEDVQRLKLDEEKETIVLEWSKLETEKKKLEVQRQQLEQKAKELADAAEKVAKQQQDIGDREEKLKKIVETYASMKADEAARLLNELADTTVLEILGRMETTHVAKILAAMDPQRAVKVTELMRR